MKKIILQFLYHNFIGIQLLKLLTVTGVSKVMGIIMDTPFSAILISPFVRKNNINMREFEPRRYRSFNEFFTRRRKPEKLKIDRDQENFISPCQGMLTAYKIDLNSRFKIKGFYYTVSELLGKKRKLKVYQEGWCLVFRLDVNNYHRYCYIDDCKKSRNIIIPGILHTVQDEALRKTKIFCQNSREYSVLQTKNWGEIIQVEVGALFVGKIVNHHQAGLYHQGQEKGYFKFGGSTIVLFIRKELVKLKEEIIENSLRGKETPVEYGEKIGVRKVKKGT